MSESEPNRARPTALRIDNHGSRRIAPRSEALAHPGLLGRSPPRHGVFEVRATVFNVTDRRLESRGARSRG
jgi:hypothetical protein